MDPQQPVNPPQQPQQPLPQPQPQPVAQPKAPGQVVSQQPNMVQPQVTQQPYAQPTYAAGPQQPLQPNQYNAQYQQLPPKKSKLKLIVIVAAVITLFIVGAVCLFLFGGGKQLVNKVSGIELENYSNTKFAFSIQAPKGWTPEEQDKEYIKEVSFKEPVGDVKDTSDANLHYASMRVNYDVAFSEYSERTEQEYFDSIKKGLQQAIKDKEGGEATEYYTPETGAIESEEATTVDGLKAYKVKIKITNYGGEKGEIGYEYGLFVFVDTKTQYEITLHAHESEAVNSKVDTILNSFTKT